MPHVSPLCDLEILQQIATTLGHLRYHPSLADEIRRAIAEIAHYRRSDTRALRAIAESSGARQRRPPNNKAILEAIGEETLRTGKISDRFGYLSDGLIRAHLKSLASDGLIERVGHGFWRKTAKAKSNP